LENSLERVCGAESVGAMHTARSRNDIGITQYRMRLRHEILSIVAEAHTTRAILLDRARQHADTLMPAYTHTQPAQPTMLAIDGGVSNGKSQSDGGVYHYHNRIPESTGNGWPNSWDLKDYRKILMVRSRLPIT
jgi:hypothetical protein